MKRLTLTSMMLLVASYGFAQNEAYMMDAYNWSDNEYYGTARTVGMGNAVTAIGGDLGTISFNPAGGAVNSYSQISITPGVALSMTTANGVATDDGNRYLQFGTKKTKGKFILPNCGFNLSFNTGNSYGLTRVSIGCLVNMTNNFNKSYSARGTNPIGTSSYAGNLASSATGVDYENWDATQILAWDTGVMGENDKGFLQGVTENVLSDGTASLAGPLGQRYDATYSGSKTDAIFNIGFDISDVVFLGASIGMTSIKYNFSDIIFEERADGFDASMSQTGFNNFNHSYSYVANATGIYGKFGIIALPVAGLRLGAAIQTPTKTNISETYYHSMYNDCILGRNSKSSDPGNGKFVLHSPFRFNLGIAYTIGQFAIVSVDYERVDYKKMRYEARYNSDLSFFDSVNETISGNNARGYHMGESNLLRIGCELRPTEELAIRAGYNLTTSPIRSYDWMTQDTRNNTHAFCLGLGYDSPGSFFCDIAARLVMRPDNVTVLGYNPIQIYDDYDNRGLDQATYKKICSPKVSTTSSMLNVVATVGWRF